MPPRSRSSALVAVAALLRGVNVGGNKRVPMGELRSLLTEAGYSHVTTLLNSGNAVFGVPAHRLDTAADDVEAAILERLGVSCAVVVRTAEELATVLEEDPLADLATDPARHLVGFLSGTPAPEFAAWLAGIDLGDDRIEIVGGHAYLWLPEGVSGGRLSKLPWERKLGVTVTSRNVTTVAKLAELAAAVPTGAGSPQ